ncbi:MAG: hypothetical protein IPN76_27830 [Saprospiraceae bacterium]|nr:hypothetical protein [Saprospiraceae bacterium]
MDFGPRGAGHAWAVAAPISRACPEVQGGGSGIHILAGKSPKEAWQRTVSELNFDGEHYLLSNDQDVVLKQLSRFLASHIVLIGKDGEVVDPNFEVSETAIRAQLGK